MRGRALPVGAVDRLIAGIEIGIGAAVQSAAAEIAAALHRGVPRDRRHLIDIVGAVVGDVSHLHAVEPVEQAGGAVDATSGLCSHVYPIILRVVFTELRNPLPLSRKFPKSFHSNLRKLRGASPLRAPAHKMLWLKQAGRIRFSKSGGRGRPPSPTRQAMGPALPAGELRPWHREIGFTCWSACHALNIGDQTANMNSILLFI